MDLNETFGAVKKPIKKGETLKERAMANLQLMKEN
jgi:hypothetical protein